MRPHESPVRHTLPRRAHAAPIQTHVRVSDPLLGALEAIASRPGAGRGAWHLAHAPALPTLRAFFVRSPLHAASRRRLVLLANPLDPVPARLRGGSGACPRLAHHGA